MMLRPTGTGPLDRTVSKHSSYVRLRVEGYVRGAKEL